MEELTAQEELNRSFNQLVEHYGRDQACRLTASLIKAILAATQGAGPVPIPVGVTAPTPTTTANCPNCGVLIKVSLT
jgi:hypothetical protein